MWSYKKNTAPYSHAERGHTTMVISPTAVPNLTECGVGAERGFFLLHWPPHRPIRFRILAWCTVRRRSRLVRHRGQPSASLRIVVSDDHSIDPTKFPPGLSTIDVRLPLAQLPTMGGSLSALSDTQRSLHLCLRALEHGGSNTVEQRRERVAHRGRLVIGIER